MKIFLPEKVNFIILGSQLAIHVSLSFLPVGVIQIVFFRFQVLFLQHLHGLFQFALPAAALADQRPHGCGKVPAKEGVQPLAHAPHTVGTLGDRGRINVVVALLSAFYPAFFFQPVQKIEHRGRGPALTAEFFVNIPPGGRFPAGPYRQHDLLLGRRQRPQPVRESVHLRSPSFRVFFTFVSVIPLYRVLSEKARGRNPDEIRLFQPVFTDVSVLSLLGVHCVLVPAQGLFRQYLCAKMLLFSCPQNRYTTATEMIQKASQNSRCFVIQERESSLWHEYTTSAQAPACCPRRSSGRHRQSCWNTATAARA